jgi:hypothetical protein
MSCHYRVLYETRHDPGDHTGLEVSAMSVWIFLHREHSDGNILLQF